MTRHKFTVVILSFAMAAAIFSGYFLLGERSSAILMQKALENNMMDTGVDNLVMTIYLNFRLFDTLFEAMLLLVCVMGVQQFSRPSEHEKKFITQNEVASQHDKEYSSLMTQGLKGVYIFVLIFGVYSIISGMNSPGGGFQGGGIVAAIIMSVHLSTGKSLLTVEKAIVVEKVMFILLLVISTLFLAFGNSISNELYRIFLIVLNFIIGVKVFCGFVILYLRFMQIGRNLHE